MRYETKAEKAERGEDKQRIAALEADLARANETVGNLRVAAKYAALEKDHELSKRTGRPGDLNTLTETETTALFRLREEEQAIDLLPMDERAWLEDNGFGT